MTIAQSMRVLYVSIDLFLRGGIQRYSRYEIRALRELLGESAVAICSFHGTSENSFEQELQVDLVGRGSGLLRKLRFGLDVALLARRCKPDLVICDHVRLGPLGFVCRLLSGARLWVNVYGLEVWGHLNVLQRRALLAANTIVSDCEFTRRLLTSRYSRLQSVIKVIPDCVDCDEFRPGKAVALRKELDLEPGPVILTVSRIEKDRAKGHEQVMKALLRMRQDYPTVRYVIAGDGDGRSDLERDALRLGLEECVHFCGGVTDDRLKELYRACDVFVLASKFQVGAQSLGEGVPLVVLEAQASGKPVVTSKLDGSAESIVDDVTGLLVDPHDPDDIARALTSVLRDGARQRAMGMAARRLAEEHFSVGVFKQRFGALLSALAPGPLQSEMQRDARA